MRVVYISEGFCTHDLRFVNAILKQGHDLLYLPLKSNTLFPEELLLKANFQILKDIKLLTQNEIKEIADVAHIGPINEITLKLLKECKIPCVLMSWGSDVLVGFEKLSLSKEEIQDGLRVAKAFIADCSFVTEKIQALLGEGEKRPIYQFPWGIDLERFENQKVGKSRIRKSLGWNKHNVFISVRKWEKEYGIEELIEAFLEYSILDVEARLILASTGTMKAYIHKLIESYHLKNKIFCPGLLDEENLPEWLFASDVYISASKSDGSSISLLEAMMCKLPVVVHKEFGNKDWIQDNVNGWLVDCHDSHSICEGMVKSMNQKERWYSIGELNQEIIMTRANWKKSSKALTAIYEHLRGTL